MEHSYKFLLEEEDYNNYIIELYNLIANTQEKIAKEMYLIVNQSDTILKYLELRREIQKGNNEYSQQIKELEKEFFKIPEEVRKEFIKSLELFTEDRLKNLFHSILNTLQNYHIIIICLYIIENRFIQQIPIEHLSEIKLNSSKLTVEQLYEALNEMYESKALLFINFIPCTNRVFDLLTNSFKCKDKDNFIRIIYDNNLDLTSINKICNINLCIQHLIFLYEQNINLASTTFPIEMPSQLKKKISLFFLKYKTIKKMY